MEHDPHALLRHQEALDRGYSDDEIRRLYSRGEWQRIGRGAYVCTSSYSALGEEERHRFLIDSTTHALSDYAILSHQSAAVVYGLPLWKTPLDRVLVTRNRRGGGRVKRRTTVHCAPMGEHVAVVDGHSLTLPARTVVDLARTLPFEQAVVVGDAAVRRFGIGREDLEAELARAARRHGVDAARRVVRFVSGHSESVGESRSRVMLSRARLPVPSQQGEVFEPGGRRIGRVDFHFDGIVLGEFDGCVKYGRLLKSGESPGDAVFAEKLREDALRDLGFEVVRWTWDDLESPGQVVERVHRAIARAGSPRGQVTPLPSAHPLTIRAL
ncbi:hypothetical protein ACFTWF_27250 [Rhodococcus sp. NPDC056960]|uniref:hypothetical protein n=1 Tax=Rhodococcus sp. NPDC056960 TaxID=3345982 RepID=UPI00362593C4